MSTLTGRALVSLARFVAVMAALLFVPAGTVAYWQAWVFLALYCACSLGIILYLSRHDPALLARRMRGGPFAETEPAQRIIVGIASLGFVALLVVPALDHRLGWSHVPVAAVFGGDAMVMLGWGGIFAVFRENSFTAATVGLMPGQFVITTGPYAIVRHPMYAAALVMLAGIPPALGSWWGLTVLAALLPVLVWRLIDEERVLTSGLPGYAEYREKVRYRLVPGLW